MQEGPRVPGLLRRQVGEKDLADLPVGGDAEDHVAAAHSVPAVVNARWGGSETWQYTIDELPGRSMLAVGTVASGLKRLENRPVFEAGLRRILETKHPTCLVVVGSASYPVFEEAREQGVLVVQFDGETCAVHKARAASKADAEGGAADV